MHARSRGVLLCMIGSCHVCGALFLVVMCLQMMHALFRMVSLTGLILGSIPPGLPGVVVWFIGLIHLRSTTWRRLQLLCGSVWMHARPFSWASG